ncbi:MAG: hypothetical protein JW812_02125 [Alphaproteobacteria bacterium]|nr:hypothetical protein [Alphaproteobacteria bacterium]MBN2779568.1 hypothetical protein [Alphaproteobacteria bacterium]
MKKIIIIIFLLTGIFEIKAQQAFGIDSIRNEMLIVIAGSPAKTVKNVPFDCCQIAGIGADSAWISEKITVVKKDNKVFLKINTLLPMAAKNIKKINGEFVHCLYFSESKRKAVFEYTRI